MASKKLTHASRRARNRQKRETLKRLAEALRKLQGKKKK